MAEDLEERKDVLIRAKTIYDDFLGRKDDAIQTVERILEIDPSEERALDELNRLYRETERWPDLVDVCNRRLDLAEDDEQRKAIWFEMGPIFEGQLDDKQRAIDVYNQVLDVAPEAVEALEALHRLYGATDNWAAMLEVLDKKRALADDPSEVLGLRFQGGQLLQHQLMDLHGAIDVYAEVLEAEPSYEPAVQALEGIFTEGVELERVAEVLSPLYRSTGAWQKLIQLHTMLVEEQSDPEQRATHFQAIADIHESELQDQGGAFQAVCVALREVPSERKFAERAERLAEDLGQLPVLVGLLQQLRDDLTDPDARLALGKQAARLLEVELGDIGGAIIAYRAVLDVDPVDESALEALDRLYERAQEWQALGEILDREIMQVEDEQESIQLRYRLGVLLADHLNDPLRAVETFNEILAIEAGHRDAIKALEGMFSMGVQAREIAPILEPHYVDNEAWSKLVGLKLAMLEHQELADDRYVTLLEAGEIAVSKMADQATALEIYGHALAERPSDEGIVEQLEELAEATGNYHKLAEIYKAAMDRGPDQFDAQRLSLRMAKTLRKHLDDKDGAMAWYQYALELDPNSVEALNALDEIYTENEQWAALSDILRRERETAMSDDELVGFGYRLAKVYEEKLLQIAEAVAAYNDVLAANPMHRGALDSLELIHQQQGNWEDLYSVYERQSTLEEEDESRALKSQQMATLAMNMLNRPEDAIDLWMRVLDVRPDDTHALRSLQGLYEQTERHIDLVEVLEKQVKLTEDTAEEKVLVEKIGGVRRFLGDDEKAVEAYERLLELEPGNPTALFALRELQEARGDAEALSEVLIQLIPLGLLDHAGLFDAYVRLGEIFGDVLARPDDAIEAWSRVLQLDPGNERALEQLERFYLEQSRWENAIGVLEQKLQRAEYPDDQVDLLYRISDLWQTKVENPSQAASAYERLLQVQPGNDQAFMSLEEIYRAQENWSKLVELYLGRLDHLPDVLDRLQVLRAAASVFEEKLGDQQSAFFVIIKMFKEEPLDPDILADMERLAEATGMWEALVEVIRDTINDVVAERGPGDTLELHQKLSTLYRDKLGRPEMAEVHFHKVLDIDPASEFALKGLEEIYENGENWNELVGILKRRLDLPIDVPEQIDLYLKIGKIQRGYLQAFDDAIHAFKMVLRTDTENKEAMSSLEGIYETRGEWRELIEVLEQRASVTYEPDEVVRVKYQIGMLWQDNLGVADRAVDVYNDILTIDQTHLPSIERLERLYVELGRWDKYLDVLEMKLALEPPAEQKIQILSIMSQVYEAEFKEMERAIDAYRQVLEIEPGRVQVIDELIRIYTGQEYWDDLVNLLEEQTPHVQDVYQRIRLLSQQGSAAGAKLGDIHRAIDSFQKVLELDPNETGALHALADLYERAGQWEECVGIYNKLIYAATEVPVKTVLLCRVGKIYELNILDDDSAMARYETALELDPGCEEALLALHDVYVKKENWASAVDMLQRAVQYSNDLGDRAKSLAKIGQLYEERLEDRTTAMEYYQQAVDLDPNNVVAAAPLAEYAMSEEQYARAVPLIEVLIKSDLYADNREGLQELRYSLGLCYEELVQEERAIEQYQASFDIDRGHLPTLQGLARLYMKREEHDRAFVVLSDMLTHYAHEMSESQVAEIYAQQAEIKMSVGERRAAQDLYERALAADPSNPAGLRRLIELLTKQEDWQQLVEYKMRLAEVTEDKIEQFTLMFESGDLFRDKLGQMEAAIEAYKAAHSVDPDSMVVLKRLLEIYTRAQQWKRTTEVLGKMAHLEQDPQRHARLCLTIASTLRDKLGEPDKAIEFYNRTLDRDVNQLSAFQAIEAIFTEKRDWKGLERQYRRMLERVSQAGGSEMKEVQRQLAKALGEIYRSRLNEYDKAIAAFKLAVQINPEDAETHAILAQLYEMVGGHEGEAVKQHHEIIEADQLRFDSYHALFDKYLALKDFDAAWCVTGPLVLLKQANEQEKAFYQRYLGTRPARLKRQLAPEQWDQLYHQELSKPLTNLMSIYSTYLRSSYANDLREKWSVHKRKDKVDTNSDAMFSKTFNYVVRVLQAPPVNVYFRRDPLWGIHNANSDPQALVAGSDIMQGRDERDLAFEIGKGVTLIRPEFYVGSALPQTANLKLFFGASVAMTNQSVWEQIHSMVAPGPEQIGYVQMLCAEASKMGQVVAAIQQSTQQYLSLGENPNYSRWLRAIEYTSDRAGLLLCGDLVKAATNINRQQEGIFKISKADGRDRTKELAKFAVSREYISLRKELGISVTE
ncbi:MAG: tetratricopeptide repeat protein [Myxococcales bacterium]|nr:tetratricopeptide repeat protein [Myxococcales bacterium]